MRHQNQKKEWLNDFQASLRRPLRKRWNYSFIHTYKPVLDDAPYRVFNTLDDYRKWCKKNLPSWLGYGQKL
ncbi:MAG: hypothetical protein A3C45_04220 [Deltaproteobacteria bacterium RIFCSPHIGHO2_02_FULL_40_28]|nr:MAG: hypothetical protein A3C45_04220 [Deltaproteobacteria bacterium RIFCSPHIGHO2_02_FULL_40_28]